MVKYLPQPHHWPWPVNCRLLHSESCDDLSFAIRICIVASAGNRPWPGYRVKHFYHIDVIYVISVDAVSTMCHWFTAWSWPWSGSGASASTGSVTSLWTPTMSLCSISPVSFVLAHIWPATWTKMIFVTAFVECLVTFTTCFIGAIFIDATSVWTACSIWAAVSTALLTAFETFLLHW